MSCHRRRSVVFLLVVAGFGATSRGAFADGDAGEVASARKIFAEGVRLYQSGDWEGARRLFREADGVHHAPAITYNLGLAEEKLGHPQAAIDAYEAYIAEAGDKGELALSAASAIAQIKGRSTRLRLETKPSGARLFVDGTALAEVAPSSVLVTAGHHVIVAQGDGWRAESDVLVRGAADVVRVLLEQEPTTLAPTASPEPAVIAAPVAPPPPVVVVAPEPGRVPNGVVWGAAFAIVPAYLLGVRTPNVDNTTAALSIVAGPLLELGHALSDTLVFSARGFVGIGPDAKPSHAWMLGPGVSDKVSSRLWVGATFIGGQLETRAHGARYGTDIVFGAMLEANFVLLSKPHGEWLVGVQPSFLLTDMSQDNTTFFLPLSFGYRSF